MTSYILSKSTYIRGRQCLKSLYLNKHRPYLRDKLSAEQLAKFARGHAVGKLAWQLFPGGVELPRPGESTALKTRNLIEEGTKVIYEACFIGDEVVIAIDILAGSSGKWQAYEIKSSGQLSDTYYLDARLQQYVMDAAGFSPDAFYLVNRDLSREVGTEQDVNELFVFTLLPELDVIQRDTIRDELKEMKATLHAAKAPDIAAGPQCMNPYPCDFRGVCWKHLTKEEKEILEQTTHQAK